MKLKISLKGSFASISGTEQKDVLMTIFHEERRIIIYKELRQATISGTR
jgi:hypothetical protein